MAYFKSNDSSHKNRRLAPPGSNVGAGDAPTWDNYSYRPSWDEIAHYDSQKGTLGKKQKGVQGFAAPGGVPSVYGQQGLGGNALPGAPGGTNPNPFTVGGNVPGVNATDPGLAGRNWLSQVLSDPYNAWISDARLRQMMEDTELAYGTAANKARQSAYASSGGDSRVQNMIRGNIPLAQGAQQARNIREHEQWRTALGDKRLGTLLMDWLSRYNQAYGIAAGVNAPVQDSSSGFSDFLGALAPLISGDFFSTAANIAGNATDEPDPRFWSVG